MSSPGTYPGRGRVLVIGRSPTVNRSVVEPLVDRGVDARGFTRPDEAADHFDARDFDLIVFGRGVLGPRSERLKRAFARNNPDIRFIDVIAPVAVEQTLAALAHDPQSPRFVRDVQVSREADTVRVTATILGACRMGLTAFRAVDGRWVPEELGDTEAEPGPFSWGAVGDFRNANSLLVVAGGTEYHLRPFHEPG